MLARPALKKILFKKSFFSEVTNHFSFDLNRKSFFNTANLFEIIILFSHI